MSEHVSPAPRSPLATFWIGLSLLLGLLLYLSFVYQADLLCAGAGVWNFIRWAFSSVI